MSRKIVYTLSLVSLFTLAIFFSCKKINLATEVGLDLVPAVDGIHTFDTTLEVFAYNNIFSAANDSFRSLVSDEQILGVINNDPIFGKTKARMFFNVSLPYSRFTFANTKDKLTLDSAVLILDYLETYGDTTMAQTIAVSELAQSNNFFKDSTYPVRKNDWVYAGPMGSKTVVPYRLKDSVKIQYNGTVKGEEDTTSKGQLRIRLDDSFGNRLLNYDTTGVNNAFYSDSTFKLFFKGFALESIGSGNGLMGFNLLQVSNALNRGTKLAIYYKYENKTTAGDIDTAVQYFRVGAGPVANAIERDYSGTSIPASLGDNIADNLVYIQNTPGVYANLKIPGLANLGNSVINLAELSMERIYDASDTIFNAPGTLFLDAYDSSISKFTTVPWVFELASDNSITNYGNFLFGRPYFYKTDPSGHIVKQSRFNLTRYVQHVVNKTVPYHNLRIYAPASEAVTIGPPYLSKNYKGKFPPGSGLQIAPGIGRIRLGGGQHPTQKMKLRIVYSKIN